MVLCAQAYRYTGGPQLDVPDVWLHTDSLPPVPVAAPCPVILGRQKTGHRLWSCPQECTGVGLGGQISQWKARAGMGPSGTGGLPRGRL